MYPKDTNEIITVLEDTRDRVNTGNGKLDKQTKEASRFQNITNKLLGMIIGVKPNENLIE